MSSKCDFNLRFSGALVSYPPDFRFARPALDLDLNLPQVPLRSFTSSKCDWRIGVQGLEAESRGGALRTVDVRLPGGRLSVGSDKCDWNLRLAGEFRPTLSASLASSKCDFRVNLGLELEQGSALRIGTVASSKCDFRFERFELREARGGDWKRLDVPAPGSRKK